jgi:hypothetical protein
LIVIAGEDDIHSLYVHERLVQRLLHPRAFTDVWKDAAGFDRMRHDVGVSKFMITR